MSSQHACLCSFATPPCARLAPAHRSVCFLAVLATVWAFRRLSRLLVPGTAAMVFAWAGASSAASHAAVHPAAATADGAAGDRHSNSEAKEEREADKKEFAPPFLHRSQSQKNEDSLEPESQAKTMRNAGYCAACVLVPREARAVSLVLLPLDIDLPSIFPHPASTAVTSKACSDALMPWMMVVNMLLLVQRCWYFIAGRVPHLRNF